MPTTRLSSTVTLKILFPAGAVVDWFGSLAFTPNKEQRRSGSGGKQANTLALEPLMNQHHPRPWPAVQGYDAGMVSRQDSPGVVNLVPSTAGRASAGAWQWLRVLKAPTGRLDIEHPAPGKLVGKETAQ